MVNILKRIRKLDDRLLKIRNGPGAAKIAPPSSKIPFVTRIHLTHPLGPGTFNAKYHGSRIFWRQHLQRLKFYNPALPISVAHDHVGGNVKKGHVEGANHTGEATTEVEQSISGERKSITPVSDAEASITVHFDESITAFEEGKSYEDYLPTQATSIPSGSKSPAASEQNKNYATSTRTATFDCRGKSAAKIWSWLKNEIGAVSVPISEEDKKRKEELQVFRRQSEIDRERVRKSVEAMKMHEQMLRKAKGDAEKMRQEA